MRRFNQQKNKRKKIYNYDELIGVLNIILIEIYPKEIEDLFKGKFLG